MVTSLVNTVKAGKLTKVWVIFTDEAPREEFHCKCWGGGSRQTSCKSKFGHIFSYITEHPNRIMGNIFLFLSIFLKNKSHYGEKVLLVNKLISLTYNSIAFINKSTIITIMQCLTVRYNRIWIHRGKYKTIYNAFKAHFVSARKKQD